MKNATTKSVRAAREGAFTLVEILIVVVILGILATIVIPQFSNASAEARENTLKDDLRYLRVQIQVFKAQHLDHAPGYPGGITSATATETDFVNQMTECSDDECNINATPTSVFQFGPYLTRMPENPMNGSAEIKIIAAGATIAPDPADAGKYGWLYQPNTQQVMANLTGNDSTGTTSFSQY
jgi:general secretion pathway protein G